jgi:hypothetical protein
MKYIVHSLLVIGLLARGEMIASGRAGKPASKGGGNLTATISNTSGVSVTPSGSTTYSPSGNISFSADKYTTTSVPGASTITITGSQGSDLSINGVTMKYTGTSGDQQQQQGTSVPVTAWSAKDGGVVTLNSTTPLAAKDANGNTQYDVTIKNASGATQKATLVITNLTGKEKMVLNKASLSALGITTGNTAALVPAT